MPTVSVKWQKEVFPSVEIDTSQPPLVFKCQLYALTGVPPERQKIMVKGGLLKDDADWATLGVKEGQKLMMMGTADEIVKAPEKGPVFMEDLPEEEQVVAVGHSAGLYNLGNTCYMNSTLQCLHSVPELKSALLSYTNSGRNNELDQYSHLLTVATRDLFGELDRNVRPVAPLQFLSILRKKYPQFAQQHNGGYMQQDAEECWTQLMYTLSQSLRSSDSSEASATVKALFGVGLVNRVYCAESSEESFENESVYALKCHISQDINHLHEGLRRGLKSELEKMSTSLGRSAVFSKESCISELPRYLTVQFVRFFWKRESNQKAKILRKVDYPLELDVYEFCSDELRQKLQTPRQTLRELENVKLGLKVEDKKKEHEVNMPTSEGSSNDSSEPSSMALDKAVSSEDKGQLTGIYDLVAVLTHKGRSADSGHYVAWVKQENGKWIQYDDDNPIPQREAPPPPADERSGTPPVATALSIPRRIRAPPFRLLPNGPATTPPPPSSWLEIRLFYVRISPCAVDAVPPHLTLSHLRREMGDALEINGARVPASDITAIPLRRDRLDRGAAEVTYVSTDSVRIAGAVDFEVCDDRGNLILCGSLQRLEAPWSNGVITVDNHHGSSDKDRKTGWGMDCYPAASAGASSFVQPKLGIVFPSIEVYVAGCSAAAPLILTQTLQVSPRRKAVKPGTLGSIPEDEETTEHEKKVNNDTLVQQRASSSLAAEEEAGGYDSDFGVAHSYHPEGWSSEEDGQLSWFNSGVRVGVGIGLGMCVGIGIGVGLLMSSYQATTRSFKRRFF